MGRLKDLLGGGAPSSAAPTPPAPVIFPTPEVEAFAPPAPEGVVDIEVPATPVPKIVMDAAGNITLVEE